MIRKIIYSILCFIVITVIQVALYVLNLDELAKITIKFFAFLLFIPFIIYSFNKYREKEKDIDLKNVKKHLKRPYNFYQWLGQEIDSDKFIYEMYKDKIEKYDVVSNLKMFKKDLEKKYGDNVEDLILLKEILELQAKKGFLTILNELSKPIFITLVTAIFTTIFLTRLSNIVKDEWNTFDFTSLVIDCGFFFVFCLYVVALFYHSFKAMNNRRDTLIKVLEIIIKEKSTNS